MKLKWKLLPLAFAAAGFIGCTDEIEGPGLNSNENGDNGEKALVSVLINTEVQTRAASGTGEEGNGNEVGSKEESDVKNVTIYLFKNGNSDTDFEFKSTSDIVARGYTTAEGSLPNQDENHPSTSTGVTSTNHGWQATIEVSFADGGSLAGNTYGVIAITNADDNETGDNSELPLVGNGTGQVNKGYQLGDYLMEDMKTDYGFVMSSHTLKDNSATDGSNAHKSIVTFPADGASQTVPEVEVFVERVVAKVRVSAYEGITGFAYTPTSATSDRVVLNEVAIINQLTNGSYLLKRVTEELEGFNPETQDLEQLPTQDNDEYLGDEKVNNNKLPIRFVIDPWTRNKSSENVDNLNGIAANLVPGYVTGTLGYNCRYFSSTGTPNLGSLWNNWTTGSSTQDIINLQDESDPNYIYVRENTTSKAASNTAFNTGALFRATYYPKQWMIIAEDGYNVTTENVSDKENIKDQQATTFYTYQGDIYEKYEGVFAYTLASIVPKGTTNPTQSGYLLFTNFNETGLQSLSVKAFNEYVSQKNPADPFGYLKFLQDKINNASIGEDAQEKTMISTVNGVVTFDVFMGKDGGNNMTEINKVVKVYTNGQCFYPSWIRHENNGDDHAHGVMEYAIVRNNLYDISVSAIKGLGLSETDVPTPEPIENDEAMIQVVLYVKDWVVRSNSGIIL